MAANPRAVMRALKATAPAPSMGGYGNQPAPYIGPGPSPLVASYNESFGAHQYGTNSALPRDWRTFLSGMFGPLAPIQPVPIDIPEPGQERPSPRRWEYPVGYDMPGYQPGQPGLGRLASFGTLRQLCDLYSVARSCIELRKSELRSVAWDIAPTAQAAKAMRGDHKAAADFAERRDQVVRFFRKPDPEYDDFTGWFNVILEELFVTDAISLYVQPSRARGKGLMGTSIAGLDLIDGALVKPLVDIRGGRPAPPNPSFQQFEYGVPRVDLMTLIEEQRDGSPPDEELVAEYRSDQLLYMPYTRRVWTPYGHSFIERALLPVLSGLNKQQYQQNYFIEGSIPGLFISPGDSSMTPSQLRELQDALNALSGDQSWKHKIIVLPGGSRIDPQKQAALADDFDTLVQIQTCMGFDVQPFEVGIIPQLSAAAASSGSARQTVTAQIGIRDRKSTVPILLFFKLGLFDRIIQNVCGQWDMEWQWDGMSEEPDAATLTPVLVEQVGAGLASIDEARKELGRDPWGLEITSDPGWATQWGGLVPLTGVTNATAQPLGGAPGPGGPGGPPGKGGKSPGGKGPAGALALPGGTPQAGGPSVAPTVPRNRLSTGQRHQQAQAVSHAQRSTGPTGTPAHAGAASAHRARTAKETGAEPSAVRKAVTAALLAEDTVPVVTDAPAAGVKPALRELGLLRSALRRGGAVSAWQPRSISQAVLAQISENLAKGMGVDLACDVAKAAITTPGTPLIGKGRTPGLTSRSGMISLDLPEGVLQPLPGGVTDHHITVVYLGPDVRDELFAQACTEARNAAAGMSGPLAGELSGIATFPASASSDGKVPAYVPAHVPGAQILRADLEHLSASEHKDWRPHVTLAYLDEGEPLPAPPSPRPVVFTHLSVHRGSEVKRFPIGGMTAKAGKKDGLRAAGLAVRAADTGRILMLQRAFDDDDGAGGLWEFPGGRLDDGETALEAAQREWAEEVGVKVPQGDLDGIWNASNGRYRGFVLTVPSEDAVDVFGDRGEVENPDHDPDEDGIEALAWWDPGQLKDNPAVRPEVLEDVKLIRRALRKSAETPVVSTVHHPLGHEGLWHTPDKHVAGVQQLPAYFQNTARALMRDHGMGEQQAIATAINAARAWAAGHAFGGKVKTTPEVQQAARLALAEWDRLKASHH